MSTSEGQPESVLRELPSEVVVRDDGTNTVCTNETWRRFGEANGLADPGGIGQNYPDVCDAGPESESAREATAGGRDGGARFEVRV